MEDWIHINTNDVISIFEKAKTGFPWGNYHNENYRRLILCYKNKINMTVNEFYTLNEATHSCCRPYTIALCLTINEYKKVFDEQLAANAYNT